MSLNLNSKHKAYMDILMRQAAYKKFKKSKGPTNNDVKAAAKASYDSSVKADHAARKGTRIKGTPYKKSWSTATAKTINKALKKAANAAIKKELKKSKYKKLASVTPEDIVKNIGTAGAFAGVAAANNNAPESSGISRRALFAFGITAIASTSFLLGSTDEVLADNKTYVKNIKNGAKGYAGGRAPAIATRVGSLGIRGDINVPKHTMVT